MPLYEEKLISPLAIRFTQQRIRTTFRDGKDVEASINEITTGPGVGDYDIVLHAPFPTIEIVRYSPNGRGTGGRGEDDRWFTFDNRRLYCLQRVAAEHWPKRVGAAVEVLYADTGAIRKKLDSLSCGLTVSIGHAFATAEELDYWDWYKAVEERAPPGLALAEFAEAAVNADDAKATVSDLLDAPGAPSSFERLANALAASELLAAKPVNSSSRTASETPSTTATEMVSGVVSQTEDWDSSGHGTPPAMESATVKKSTPAQLVFAVLKESLTGVWTGDKGETYTVSCRGFQWHCVREDSHSTKKFSFEQDNVSNVLWWGVQRTYYVAISELTENPNQLRWYGARDQPGRRCRFMWQKTHGAWEQDESLWQGGVEATWSPPRQVPAQSWQAQGRPTKWQHAKSQPAQQHKSAGQKSSKWVAVANAAGA